MKRNYETLFIDSLMGELSEAEEIALEELLAGDDELRLEYQEMRKTMSLIDEHQPSIDPGEAYWDNVWHEFQNRALMGERKDEGWLPKFGTAAWEFFWKPALQIGVVAAMLFVGVFVGSELTKREVSQIGNSNFVEIPAADQKELSNERQQMMMTVADSSIQQSSDILNQFMGLTPVAESPQRWNNFRVGQDEMISLTENITLLRSNSDDPRIIQISPILEEVELVIGEIAMLHGHLEIKDADIKIMQDVIRDRQIIDRLQQVRIVVSNNIAKGK